jgi:replicative DNA helicase
MIQPHNIELEKTVLGKLLNIEKFELQAKFVEDMNEEFFFDDCAKAVFNAINSCIEQNTLASPMHLISRSLVSDDALTDILTYKFETNQKMSYKINDLKLLAYRREAILSAQQFIDDMVRGDDVVVKSEKFLLETTNALTYGKRRKRKTSKDMIKNSLIGIREGTNKDRLVEYNVPFIDKRIQHERGQMHIIGAKPGHGKTAIGLTCVRNAILAGKRCIFFVKESSKEELFERMIAQETGVAYNEFKFNWDELNSNLQGRVIRAYEMFAKMWDNIHFFGCDDYIHDLSQIDEITADVTEQYGRIDFHVTDYIQNMKAPRWMKNAQKHDIIEYNTEGLNSLYKRHDVAGILLAQLNRDINGKPHLANLKGASALEQEGHIISFLYRKDGVEAENGMVLTEFYNEKQRLASQFSGVNLGLRVPAVDFVEMTGYTEKDRPKSLKKPTV